MIGEESFAVGEDKELMEELKEVMNLRDDDMAAERSPDVHWHGGNGTKYKNSDCTHPLKGVLFYGLCRCMKAAGAQAGSIFLLEKGKKELILEITRRRKDFNSDEISEVLGDRMGDPAALARKLLAHLNCKKSPLRLSVPLEFSGNVLGIIQILDKSTGEPFDEGDLRIVKNIAGYLAVTVFNLQTYLGNQDSHYHQLKKECEDLKISLARAKKFSSLGMVAGNLIHEINNPLDGSIRYVNLALESLAQDDPGKEYLGEARKGLTRIAAMVKSLMEFSWGLSSREREIDVNQEMEKTLAQLNPCLLASGIKVKKHFSLHLPKLPACSLGIVLNNIVKNACAAMKQGGTFSISTGIKNKAVEIRFKDTGPGMPHQVRERMFDPFFTTKKKGEGTGLGLAISHEIIQRYEGKMVVKSKPGKGVIFIIRIPIKNNF